MRQADSDLLVISPRIGIQSFGEREERLDAHGIVRTMRDAFTDLWIPRAQERHLLFTRGAFDDGRYRRARHRLHDRLGDLGLSHLGGLNGCGFHGFDDGSGRRNHLRWFRPPPLRRPPNLGRGLDDLLIVDERRPIEVDVGMLRFNLPNDSGIQWLAADTHAGRRAEYIENP